MLYNRKTNRERRGGILAFRVTQDERKTLERLSKESGLSFSGIFRQRVLCELKPYRMTADEKRTHAESCAIVNRTDISDAEKEKLCGELMVRAIHRIRIAHEKLTKARERATVRKYRGKRSA